MACVLSPGHTTSMKWPSRGALYLPSFLCTDVIVLNYWRTRIFTNVWLNKTDPDSKVYGAYMGPTWVRQDPGGPHIGPMSLTLLGTIEVFVKYPVALGFLNSRWAILYLSLQWTAPTSYSRWKLYREPYPTENREWIQYWNTCSQYHRN